MRLDASDTVDLHLSEYKTSRLVEVTSDLGIFFITVTSIADPEVNKLVSPVAFVSK